MAKLIRKGTSFRLFPVRRYSVLGRGALSAEERGRRWSLYLGSLKKSFDPALNMISSTEARTFPKLAVRLRSQILHDVYAGDDPASDFEFEVRARRLVKGQERVFFWGEAAEIARVRQLAKSLDHPSSAAPRGIELGTCSLLDRSAYYGFGYWEAARVGSMSRKVEALAPILYEFLQALYLETPQHCHTVVCMPRNRRSADKIRGGAAVYRMAAQSVGAWFWGFAPWYRMQGGFIECLDYREIYQRPEEVERSINSCPPPVFVSQQEAEFAQALIDHNLGGTQRNGQALTCRARRETGPGLHWRITCCGEAAKAGSNPCLVRSSSRAGGSSFEQALDAAEGNTPAAAVVFLPLNKALLGVQEILRGRGYTLSALMPPKRAGEDEWIGQWVGVNQSMPLISPFYLEALGATPSEQIILSYLRSVVLQGTLATNSPGCCAGGCV